MTLQSMTYGQLPSREDFDAAFTRELQGGKYWITLGHGDSEGVAGFALGDGEWTAEALWSAICEIVNFPGDKITVSEDEDLEDVYQIFYPGTDRAPIEIGPDEAELIEWAQKFCQHHITSIEFARQALNFAAAYFEFGHDFTRWESAMDLVSGILGTLGFEWI
jgi:hypothetical protein